MCYVHLPLLLIKQSCWLIDVALLTTEEMNEELLLVGRILGPTGMVKINECLEELMGKCEKLAEWQNKIQNLLRWNFKLEFQIQ